MKTKQKLKLYIKGTGARDTKTFDKTQIINKTLTFGKFGPIGGGTAFKRVLRLRIQLRDPGPTAFKRVLRLRIYKILFPFNMFSSFQSG